MISIQNIQLAQKRIQSYIYSTPLVRVKALDEVLKCKVYIKAENMQISNSFKIRGALNKILSMPEEQLQNGIVVTSSGSHAIATSYAARLRGVKVIAILRDTSPQCKRKLIQELGSEVIVLPHEKRIEKAEELVDAKGYTYIHPYEDYDIMNGHGTVGLEIIDENPSINKIVIPMGGGGLAAGLSTAVKMNFPNIKIIGCEPTVFSRFTRSIEAGRPIEVKSQSSVADALLPLKPGEMAFPYIQRNVDKILTVNERSIINGAFILLTKGKIFAEISSAIVIGAVLQDFNCFSKEDKVCFLISGGNSDINILHTILHSLNKG